MVSNCFQVETLYTCRSKEESLIKSPEGGDSTGTKFNFLKASVEKSADNGNKLLRPESLEGKEVYSFDSSDVDSDKEDKEESKKPEEKVTQEEKEEVFVSPNKEFSDFVNSFKSISKTKLVKNSKKKLKSEIALKSLKNEKLK